MLCYIHCKDFASLRQLKLCRVSIVQIDEWPGSRKVSLASCAAPGRNAAGKSGDVSRPAGRPPHCHRQRAHQYPGIRFHLWIILTGRNHLYQYF
eukprot:6185450-Pleurochrysis_carterae.AAC.1